MGGQGLGCPTRQTRCLPSAFSTTSRPSSEPSPFRRFARPTMPPWHLTQLCHRGGLIILGASFARIKITRARLLEMPIGAMFVSESQKKQAGCANFVCDIAGNGHRQDVCHAPDGNFHGQQVCHSSTHAAMVHLTGILFSTASATTRPYSQRRSGVSPENCGAPARTDSCLSFI